MLRIAVCEDMRAEAVNIALLLQEYRGLHSGIPMESEIFGAAEEVLAALQLGRRFDLYLLDIMMPGMDGIMLARQLRSEYGRPCVIFLTSSREYAVEAFAARAINYLLKPITQDNLFPALDDAIASFGIGPGLCTSIATAHAEQLVKLADIVYVEVTGHRLSYYLNGGRQLDSKVLRISFEEAAGDLLAASSFLRPHRSYLVNAAHIERMTKATLQMDNGAIIPISRLRYNEVRHRYMRYLGQEGGQ